jgi:hypothetical protein
MKIYDKEELRLWVETWKKAGKALEEIKRHKLQSYNYPENQEIIDSMLQFAYKHRKPRLTSGLVEQQRWFMKMREKQLQKIEEE